MIAILVVSGFGALCILASIIAAIAIPSLIAARKGSNEAAAIDALRAISTAEARYRDADQDGDGAFDYAPRLDDLARHGSLIDSVLAKGTKQGYLFRVEVEGDGRERFRAYAVPQSPGKSGDRAFFVDETGVIRWAPAGRGPATESDPPLERVTPSGR